MKINQPYSYRQVGDEYLMMLEELGKDGSNKALSLNETAVYLLDETGDKEVSVELWSELLMQRYDVSEEVARADAQQLIDDFCKLGLIID